MLLYSITAKLDYRTLNIIFQ